MVEVRDGKAPRVDSEEATQHRTLLDGLYQEGVVDGRNVYDGFVMDGQKDSEDGVWLIPEERYRTVLRMTDAWTWRQEKGVIFRLTHRKNDSAREINNTDLRRFEASFAQDDSYVIPSTLITSRMKIEGILTPGTTPNTVYFNPNRAQEIYGPKYDNPQTPYENKDRLPVRTYPSVLRKVMNQPGSLREVASSIK